MEHLARSPQSIASAVLRKRRLLDLSQHQLAERSGLRAATISDLETISVDTKLKTLCTLLAALDLELVIRDRTKSPKIEDIF